MIGNYNNVFNKSNIDKGNVHLYTISIVQSYIHIPPVQAISLASRQSSSGISYVNNIFTIKINFRFIEFNYLKCVSY